MDFERPKLAEKSVAKNGDKASICLRLDQASPLHHSIWRCMQIYRRAALQ